MTLYTKTSAASLAPPGIDIVLALRVNIDLSRQRGQGIIDAQTQRSLMLIMLIMLYEAHVLTLLRDRCVNILAQSRALLNPPRTRPPTRRLNQMALFDIPSVATGVPSATEHTKAAPLRRFRLAAARGPRAFEPAVRGDCRTQRSPGRHVLVIPSAG
jgi:hypothetical protein